MPVSPETNLPSAPRMVSTGAASTMSSEVNRQGFVASKLPWLLGAAALVIFLATLNQWVNLRSLGYVARVTGWESELPVQFPLFYALTFPFRYLPAAIQPVALN